MRNLLDDVNKIAEQLIIERKMQGKLANMFKKCFVNTVETTVEFLNEDDVFIITGDIEAMWLRDSSAQVVQYMNYLNESESLKKMVELLIKKQFYYIGIDPYANAFNKEPNGRSWTVDEPKQNEWVWERKYEIDSLCYPIRLLYDYWKITGDKTIFTENIYKQLNCVINTWNIEQKHFENSKYYFIRKNCPECDTLSNNGHGNQVAYTGMIWSGFRPSDDACKYGYHIPSNMFASVVLGYIAEFAEKIYNDIQLKNKAIIMQSEINNGIQKYGITNYGEYGSIYVYETDGLGNQIMMDDANVPSLLSIPWLRFTNNNDVIYCNTRKFILSENNPYYFEGTCLKGIGSQHTPANYVWSIALCMQGLTSSDKNEKHRLLEMLMNSDANTGYMHEGIDCCDENVFTRPWFAWANSLFANFVLNITEESQGRI